MNPDTQREAAMTDCDDDLSGRVKRWMNGDRNANTVTLVLDLEHGRAELQSRLQETEQRLSTLELELRKEWWLGHGHSAVPGALYGDNGEMQCHECGLWDYRRAPLDELRRQVDRARIERISRDYQRQQQKETHD